MIKSEYEIQADEFLNKAGAKMRIVKIGEVQGFPFDKTDKMRHDKYRVTLFRNGESYSFLFYGSYNDYRNFKRPTHYDVLACVEKYDSPHNVNDFAAEYGYEIDEYEDYERVEKIMKACNTQYARLLDLFGERLMEDLREIC